MNEIMTTETEQFGVHLMIDGYGAPADALSDKEALKEMLVVLPKLMGMHTISDPFVVEVGPLNRKDPGGVSGFIIIAESHIAFHTFPKRGFVTIDVYTCQNMLDTKKFEALFIEKFKLQTTDIYIQKRGLRYPSENVY